MSAPPLLILAHTHPAAADLAWTEGEVASKLWRRKGRDWNLFCFESALKALYWSWWSYSEERCLATGLRLFEAGSGGLKQHVMLTEELHDSKCCIAW